MDTQTTQQVVEAIKELSVRLGVAAHDLLNAYAHRVAVTGYIDLAWGVALAVAAAWSARQAFKFYKEGTRKGRKQEDMEIEAVWIFFILWCCAFVVTIAVSFGYVKDGIIGISSPEVLGFQQLIQDIRGK